MAADLAYPTLESSPGIFPQDNMAEAGRNEPMAKDMALEPILQYLDARQKECQRLLNTFPQAWEQFNRIELRRKLALATAAL